jgi:UDP-glucose 4-epimerase
VTRYLVTGGTGFIGSALVRRLVRDGHRVRVLDNDFRGRADRLAGVAHDIEAIAGDIRDAQAVARACSGVDAVFHLAAINGTELFYSMPHTVLDVGVRGMLNVLDAAAGAGVAELFVASSSEVYNAPPRIPTDEAVPLVIPDPLNPRFSYAGAKLISELLAVHVGGRSIGRVVVFRPHNAYGPDMGREHVIPQLALRIRSLARASTSPVRVPIQGTGAETRAYAFIDDIVDGLLVLADRGEHLGIYHLGADRETSVRELATEIGRCFGRDVEVVAGPVQAGSVSRRCPDIAKLRALGYEPRVTLRDGLRATVDWYDAHAEEAS